MSRRPDRWWRPTTVRRPAQRARARRMYTGEQLDATFETGYRCGELNGRKNSSDGAEVIDLDAEMLRRAQEADPERFHEIAEAVREGGDAVRRLAREWGIDLPDDDDLLDVADATGVTPLELSEPGQLVDEVVRWLRDQG